MEGTTGSHENGGPPKAPSPSTLPLKAALPVDATDERKPSPATADDALAALVSLSSRTMQSAAAHAAPPATPPTKTACRESAEPPAEPAGAPADEPPPAAAAPVDSSVVAVAPDPASAMKTAEDAAPTLPSLPAPEADAHPTTQPPSSASVSGPAEATSVVTPAMQRSVSGEGESAVVAAEDDGDATEEAAVAATEEGTAKGASTDGDKAAAATANDDVAVPPAAVDEGPSEAMSSSTDPQEPNGPPPPTPAPHDLPCMRGELRTEANGSHAIAGQWGMTAAAHGLEGQTSPFELRLAPPRPGQDPHPPRCSGVYAGFFMLMQGAGKPPLKVDEKMVHLTYIANSCGGHNVQGTGKNRFGQFTVTGLVEADGTANLYRAYVPKPKPEKSKTDGRKRGAGVGRGGAASRPRTGPRGNLTINASLASSTAAAVAAAAAASSPSGAASSSPGPSSPRGLGGKTIQSLSESAGSSSPVEAASPGGRSKRTTAGDWKSKADIPSNREPAPERAPGHPRAPSVAGRKGKGKEHASPGGGGSPLGPLDGVDLPSSVADAGQSKAGRVRRLPTHLQDTDEKEKVRLNEHMRKCVTVLRDVGKQPNAHWFAVPVDWRGLGLLDYPKVVARPMDFATIKRRVETGEMATPDEFKEAMLLVFRNAVAYNAKADNLVHVAALAVKAVFEAKFRAVIEPLGPIPVKEEAPAAAAATAGGGNSNGGGSGSGRGGRKGQGSRGGASRGPGRARANSSAGRVPGVVGGMVPQEHFVALQQQMEMMQQQLETLKRQTSQTEVNMQAQMQLGQLGGGKGGGGGGARRSKAAGDVKPLTEEEKEALKQGISGLPSEKLPRVVEIIKERMSVDDRDQEIEIDLDALDPPTLHHLQRYVKTCTSRKRKKAAAQQAPDSPGMLQHLPSPGLPDLDIDINALEADVLGMHEVDGSDPKRNRGSLESMVLESGSMFGQGSLPDALETDS